MFSPVRDLTTFFRALTSASRLRIVEQLARARGELSVGELAARLQMSQPLVSWHLRDLRRIKLVQMRRSGRQAFCSLNREQLTHYEQMLAQLLKQATGDAEQAAQLARPAAVVRRQSQVKERS